MKRLDLYQRNRIPRTGRIVEESSANGKLFHLETEESFREVFGKRKLGAERKPVALQLRRAIGRVSLTVAGVRNCVGLVGSHQ